MIIATDFDGTCVTHEYPDVGEDVPGAVSVLKELVAANHKLILYTMRSGKTLADARDWFSKHEISLWAVNTNPQQSSWTVSPKVFANKYIDDAAINCPLVQNLDGRPFVDWVKVRDLLVQERILPEV